MGEVYLVTALVKLVLKVSLGLDEVYLETALMYLVTARRTWRLTG